MKNYDKNIKALKGASRLEIEQVAFSAGVPFHTLLKVVSGETKDPRLSLVRAVDAYKMPIGLFRRLKK